MLAGKQKKKKENLTVDCTKHLRKKFIEEKTQMV